MIVKLPPCLSAAATDKKFQELTELLERNRQEAIRNARASGILLLIDIPAERLPDAPDRGYPRPPAMNRQKGK